MVSITVNNDGGGGLKLPKYSNRPGFPVPGLAILSYPGPGQVTFFIPVPVPVPVNSGFLVPVPVNHSNLPGF